MNKKKKIKTQSTYEVEFKESVIIVFGPAIILMI